MARLVIKTEGNSVTIGTNTYQKGRVFYTETTNGIIINGHEYLVSEVECNGLTKESKAELLTWLNENVFNNGGSAGGDGGVESVTGSLVSGTSENPIINNPLLEIHHVLVTDGGNRTITDFKGTLSIVKNGIDQVDSFTLTWDDIPEETSKLTLMFTFGCDNITNEAVNGASISWLPSKADKDDVWEVVYDKFYQSWVLVSLSNSITSSDLSMMPQGGMVPKYSPQGLLSTNWAQFPENAVPLDQMNDMLGHEGVMHLPEGAVESFRLSDVGDLGISSDDEGAHFTFTSILDGIKYIRINIFNGSQVHTLSLNSILDIGNVYTPNPKKGVDLNGGYAEFIYHTSLNQARVFKITLSNNGQDATWSDRVL